MRRPGRMIRQVLYSVVRKPATVRYPHVKVTMPMRFRGKLRFYAERCIGCKLCMRDCPTDAIHIRQVGATREDATGRGQSQPNQPPIGPEKKAFEADIDMAKCIYCAQCVDSCPKKALESTGEFELAQLTREKLRQTHRGQPPSPGEPSDKA